MIKSITPFLWFDRQADEESRCGWLTDKYGLSWQIIPTALGELMNDDNEAKARAVFEAMMQMVKIDIAALKEAYDKA